MQNKLPLSVTPVNNKMDNDDLTPTFPFPLF